MSFFFLDEKKHERLKKFYSFACNCRLSFHVWLDELSEKLSYFVIFLLGALHREHTERQQDNFLLLITAGSLLTLYVCFYVTSLMGIIYNNHFLLCCSILLQPPWTVSQGDGNKTVMTAMMVHSVKYRVRKSWRTKGWNDRDNADDDFNTKNYS